MKESSFNFSSVSLPGVGGTLNPATAISSDKLEEMNKSGKKWRTDKQGNLRYFEEMALEANKASRHKRESLINRARNENATGEDAMMEIMGRRKARRDAFTEIKRKEYNFADDSELMAIPQSFLQQRCSNSCKGPGKCSCKSCKAEEEYREWSTEKRKQLFSGTIKGEFAGPDMSFPIASPEDIQAAWSSVGRSKEPRKVMANIIRIAKKYGWESGLPETVKERLDKGESGLPSPEFREWPEAKRERLQEGALKGEFAGPGMSFPIAGPKDVSAAWSSVGRTANPRKVMSEIIRIAKKYGWESGLPETVKQRLKEGQSGLPE